MPTTGTRKQLVDGDPPLAFQVDVLRAFGWTIEEREQFGERYAYAYSPDYSHTHGERCVGVCGVPSRFVVDPHETVDERNARLYRERPWVRRSVRNTPF
jgi:hypothetical protein